MSAFWIFRAGLATKQLQGSLIISRIDTEFRILRYILTSYVRVILVQIESSGRGYQSPCIRPGYNGHFYAHPSG